jgi:hypothetical protein
LQRKIAACAGTVRGSKRAPPQRRRCPAAGARAGVGGPLGVPAASAGTPPSKARLWANRSAAALRDSYAREVPAPGKWPDARRERLENTGSARLIRLGCGRAFGRRGKRFQAFVNLPSRRGQEWGVTIATTDAEAIGSPDPRRFELVFERHFDSIHRYLARRVGRDLADDLAAETFAVAFKSRRRYDAARADARPWLYGIASNLLRHHRRREERQLRAYAAPE